MNRNYGLMALALAVLPGAVAAREVTCESRDRQRVECDMVTNGNVRMVRQLSKTACVDGETYGFAKHSVWVQGGCRAVFAEDPEFAGRGAAPAAHGSSEPTDAQVAACNAVEDHYGKVVSFEPLKPGAFEIILRYDNGDYVCNVDASNRVSYFEPLRGGTDDATSANADDDNGTASRAGRGDFDARSVIPCAQVRGQPMGQCPAAVARGRGGDATVAVTWPDGRTRMIFFEDGDAVSADTSQADGYGEFKARKEADLYIISVGQERYEIPEAVIFGG